MIGVLRGQMGGGAHLALHVVFTSHIQQFIYDAVVRRQRLIRILHQRFLISCIHLVAKRSSAPVHQTETWS